MCPFSKIAKSENHSTLVYILYCITNNYPSESVACPRYKHMAIPINLLNINLYMFRTCPF